MEEAPPVYRFPMRARTLDEDPCSAATVAVREGVAGIGEPLEHSPGEPDEAILMTRDEHGEKSARMLDRFMGLPDGTLVWTRTGPEEYALGRLAGEWEYTDSPARLGIAHVRPTTWLERPFPPAETPAGVTDTFARGGRNFQRIRDKEAALETLRIWRKFEP